MWPDGSSYTRSSAGAVGSFAVHAVLAALLAYLSVEPEKPPEPQVDLVEFIVPEPEPEKPPEPEPEPELEPEKPPEVVPEVRKEEPPPKPRKVKPAPTSDKPVNDEPPPPLRIDASQAVQTGNSGVSVQTGKPGGTPGGTGKPDSQGKGSRPVGSETGDGNSPAWEPRSELYIRELPAVLNVPQEQCPAVQELGVEGVVILTVQVRRDGSVKDVRVARDIGHGCGKIAARALRKAKFRPAIATNGQPADFELRYEYEFQLGD
jgi:protein TonB